MEFEKPTPETLAVFDTIAPSPPVAERKQMFGYPAVFVNGNIAMSVFANDICFRLAPEDRDAFLAVPGASPMVVMGKAMREYAIAPDAFRAEPARYAPWVERAVANAASMPPKEPKPRKSAMK